MINFSSYLPIDPVVKLAKKELFITLFSLVRLCRWLSAVITADLVLVIDKTLPFPCDVGYIFTIIIEKIKFNNRYLLR